MNVRVKPTANLSKLEEVLVITKKEERMPSVATTGGARAVDILAQRLPSVPDKPAEVPKKQSSAAAAATPQLGTDKVKAQPTGISPKPMEGNSQAGSVHDAKIIPGAPEAATSTKPASGDLKIKSPGIKSAGSTIIKPATQQKTVPPPMKVSEKIAKPAVSTPKPPAKQPPPNQSAPNQPEARQPTNPPVTKPAAPPQEEPVPQDFLQAFVPLRFPFFAIFDLPLLVTIFFAVVRRNPVTGLLTGSVIGLLQDSLTHNPIGLYGIAKTVVGYGASSLGVRLDVENAGARLLLTLFFYMVHEIVYFMVGRGLVGLTAHPSWAYELGAAFANAVLAVLLFAALDKFKQRT